jgi:hypothetical protein
MAKITLKNYEENSYQTYSKNEVPETLVANNMGPLVLGMAVGLILYEQIKQPKS